MRRLTLPAATVVAALALAAPASAADPIPGALYEGTTEFGVPFQFKVSPDGAAITDVLTSVSLYCIGREPGFIVSALAPDAPFPVAGGTISGKDDDTYPWMEMKGTFTSPTEASGTAVAGQLRSVGTNCLKEFAWSARTAAGGGASTPGGGPPTPPEVVGGAGPSASPAIGRVPAVKVSFPRGVKLRPSLSNGWIVGGTVAGPTTLTGVVKLSKRDAKRLKIARKAVVVDRATEIVRTAGEFGLEFKPKKALAKKLRRAKRLTFSLAITATGTNGAKKTTRRKITLGP